MTELTCIVCPVGCQLTVDEHGEVNGNQCKRGQGYAVTELTNPTRMVTSTVKTTDTHTPRLSVKTDKPISKKLVFETMKELDKVEITESTKVGDCILEHILGTDVNIVATKEVIIK